MTEDIYIIKLDVRLCDKKLEYHTKKRKPVMVVSDAAMSVTITHNNSVCNNIISLLL